jgi:AcrR family transcriptional regulator
VFRCRAPPPLGSWLSAGERSRQPEPAEHAVVEAGHGADPVAQRLSYQQGVNVGVDALLSAANVARRSLYEHFGGKDGLIAEVLRRAAAEDLDRYRSVIAAAGDDPRQRLLAVFDMLDQVVSAPDFRGCRYLGADLALAEQAHPAHAITRQYRQALHQLLAREVKRLGLPRPAHVTDQLMLLIEGTLATGGARPASRPARDARELAQRILG